MEKEGKSMAIEYGKQLTKAAGAGDIAEVKRLTKLVSVNVEEYKQSLYSTPDNFKTPLHEAASNGHLDVLVLLLKEGADCDAVDRFDITPLHLAANFGHLNCLQALLDTGAKCSVHSKQDEKAKTLLWNYPRDPCYLEGSTPLHLCAQNNHIECMRELILNAADYNAVDAEGRTPLFISAAKGASDGVMVQLNCAVGKDILSLPVNSTANTPLHECVQKQMTECVVELLKHGADANAINCSGSSPLLLACSNSSRFNFDVLKAIVFNAHNLDISQHHYTSQYTPLHRVSFAERHEFGERRPKISEFLLAFGADGNIYNNFQEHLMLRELVRDPPDFTIINALIGTLKTLPRLADMVKVCRVSERVSNAPMIRVTFNRDHTYGIPAQHAEQPRPNVPAANPTEVTSEPDFYDRLTTVMLEQGFLMQVTLSDERQTLREEYERRRRRQQMIMRAFNERQVPPAPTLHSLDIEPSRRVNLDNDPTEMHHAPDEIIQMVSRAVERSVQVGNDVQENRMEEDREPDAEESHGPVVPAEEWEEVRRRARAVFAVMHDGDYLSDRYYEMMRYFTENPEPQMMTYFSREPLLTMNDDPRQFMSRQHAYLRRNAMQMRAAHQAATRTGNGSSSSSSSGAGSSGSNTSSRDLASDSSFDQKLQSSFDWYEDVRSEPRSLKVLARIAVREALTPKRLKLVGQLRFPTSIKEFILLGWPVPNFNNTSEDTN